MKRRIASDDAGPSGARRLVGGGFIDVYRLWQRVAGKGFSLLASGGFASFGAHSVLQPPVRLSGEHRIAIGSDVFIGAGAWLQVVTGPSDEVALRIGDGSSIVGGCVISAVASVRLGRQVLIARNAYVSDHSHAFGDPSRAILAQGVTKVEPVVIDDGAWLGENVVVGPGVRIGRGAVIGANSVVLSDVPDHGIAVGAPARVIRRYAEAAEPPA